MRHGCKDLDWWKSGGKILRRNNIGDPSDE